MEVIPVINCLDFACVRKRLEQVKAIDALWAHIDIADGKFTPAMTWNNPEELKPEIEQLGLSVEVHLMVEQPETVAEAWLKAGVKRLIVHIESCENVKSVLDICERYGVELGCAAKLDFHLENAIPCLVRHSIPYVQVLAVPPGPASQKFDERALERIEFLREKMPDIKIEVDGGMTLETARRVKDAGADIITSSAYIFESSDPKAAYNELRAV